MPIRVARAAVLKVAAVGPRPHVTPATVTLSPVTPSPASVKVPLSAVDYTVGRAVVTQIHAAGIPQVDSNMEHMASGWAYENQHVTTMARIMLPTGIKAVQGDISSITRNIYDLGGQSLSSLQNSSLTVSAVVYNGLQVDGYWGADEHGYNFRDTATYFADATAGGGKYRIEYEFNTSSHGDIFVVSEINMRPVMRH